MERKKENWGIRRQTLEDLFMAARNVYPNEFIAMLGVSGQNPFLISEWVVVPAEFGKSFSSLRTDLVPFDSLIVGSVHSHPSPSARASSQDLNAFARMGKIHLILSHPYAGGSFAAYSSDGKIVEMRVV